MNYRKNVSLLIFGTLLGISIIFLFNLTNSQSSSSQETLTIEEKDACESGFLKIEKKSYNSLPQDNCRFWQNRNVVFSDLTEKTIYKLNDPVYAESMELYKYAKSNGFETYNDFVEKTGCTSYTKYNRDTFAPMTWRPFDKPLQKSTYNPRNDTTVSKMAPYCPVDEQIGNLFVAKTNGFDSCSAEWSTSYERCLCSKWYAPHWCKERKVKEVKNNNYNLWVVTGMNSPVFSTGVVGNLTFIRTFSNRAACQKLAPVYTKITLDRSATHSLGFCLPSNLTELQVRDRLKSNIDLLGS